MRIACYVRVSSDEQAASGQSIDVQLAETTAWAQAQPGATYEVFNDAGYSRQPIDKRPELAKLRSRLDEFEVVVFTRQDRFAVTPDWEEWEGLALRHGVTLHDLDSPHASALERGVKGLLGRHETVLISSRVKAVLAQNAEHGFLQGSLPYGYRYQPEWELLRDGQKVHGPVVVDDDEVAIIHRIDRQYLDGWGATTIAVRLNDDDVAPPGRKGRRGRGLWNAQAVVGILERHLYHGVSMRGKTKTVGRDENGKTIRVHVPEDEWVSATAVQRHPSGNRKLPGDPIPVIRTPETFDAIRRNRKSRSSERPSGAVGLFTGKARCGQCGGGMSVKRDPGKPNRLVCTQHVKYRNCPAPVKSMKESALMTMIMVELNAARVGEKVPEMRFTNEAAERLERDLDNAAAKLQLATENLRDPAMMEQVGRAELLTWHKEASADVAAIGDQLANLQGESLADIDLWEMLAPLVAPGGELLLTVLTFGDEMGEWQTDPEDGYRYRVAKPDGGTAVIGSFVNVKVWRRVVQRHIDHIEIAPDKRSARIVWFDGA